MQLLVLISTFSGIIFFENTCCFLCRINNYLHLTKCILGNRQFFFFHNFCLHLFVILLQYEVKWLVDKNAWRMNCLSSDIRKYISSAIYLKDCLDTLLFVLGSSLQWWSHGSCGHAGWFDPGSDSLWWWELVLLKGHLWASLFFFYLQHGNIHCTYFILVVRSNYIPLSSYTHSHHLAYWTHFISWIL